MHIENSYAFLSSIYSYDIVSAQVGVGLASILPSLQIALGVTLLFFSSMWRVAFSVTAGLFLLISIVQIVTYYRGLNISCGCFSASDDNPIGLLSIGLVSVCFIFAVLGAVLSKINVKQDC